MEPRSSQCPSISNPMLGCWVKNAASACNAPFGAFRFIGYGATKAALNVLTVQFVAELRDSGIKVDSVDPGYTAADLNGHRGRPEDTGGSSGAYSFGASVGLSLTGMLKSVAHLLPKWLPRIGCYAVANRMLRTYKEFKCNLKLR